MRDCGGGGLKRRMCRKVSGELEGRIRCSWSGEGRLVEMVRARRENEALVEVM
jgi:hypothetical protein